MRTLPVPAFQAAPEEPILCTFEPQSAPGAFPGEVLHRVPAGRKAVRPRVEYYYRQLKALPRRVRRALARRYARSLAGVALLLALGQLPALAATITVGGSCTLVDAITAANRDIATGGCPAGSGADVIGLTGDVELTTIDNTTDGLNGLPSVASPITIDGNIHTLQRSTVSGTPDFRLLHVAETGNLTLNQITLRNGRASDFIGVPEASGGAVFNLGTVALNETTISGNSAHNGDGGGVSNYGGILTVTNSTVSGNTASFGGSGDGHGGAGGGISNSGTATLTNSTVSSNNSAGDFIFIYGGGGLSNTYRGTLTLTNSTVSGNTATVGGGVDNGGTATLSNSTVSGNQGGGVNNIANYSYYGTTLTLTDSTISGNSGTGIGNSGGTLAVTRSSVSGNDSGLYNAGVATFTESTVSENGSGAYNYGSLTLADSTVSGNSGDGLRNREGSVTLAASTVSGNGGIGLSNVEGDLTLTNSTVSGNSGGGVDSQGDCDDLECSHAYTTLTNSTVVGNSFGLISNDPLTLSRTVVSGNNLVDIEGSVDGGFNLVGHDGDAGGFFPGPTDIVPSVPLSDILAPLADNGGPTQTHALVLGSPAIDASPIDKDCAATDQRGVFRPQGAACDIGAFEVGVEPDPFASPTPTTGCTVNGVPDQLCRGTSGPDRILGTTGNDVILGLKGDDHLNGSRGDDRLFGGENNDRIIGSKGDDQLLGQTGDDDLRGFAGNDLVEGGDGNDRLKGHEGNDRLRGGDGDDALRGLEGQDTLEGGAGSDLLRGGGGEDDLNGGSGADRLVGGGGIDRCTSDAEDNIVVLCE